MAEKRKSNRRRVLKGGIIEFERSAFSCTVRNLSESGAALDVPTLVGIPHEFNLLIESNPFIRPCRVIWRKQNRIGVALRAARKHCSYPSGCPKSLTAQDPVGCEKERLTVPVNQMVTVRTRDAKQIKFLNVNFAPSRS